MTTFEVPTGCERFSAVPGAAELGWVPVVPTGELTERRSAVDALGGQLRRLRAAAAATEQTAEVLRQAASALAVVADLLDSGVRRRRDEPAGVDDVARGLRMYNPVWGTGSPLAPPMRVELVADAVVGRCCLDLSYEGPPSFAHGGVSAMLLDQLLGMAVVAAGHPSVTRRLEVDYRRPVPLETPLEIRSTGVRKVAGQLVATGEIAAEGDVLVRAEGWFVELRPDQARRFLKSGRAAPRPSS